MRVPGTRCVLYVTSIKRYKKKRLRTKCYARWIEYVRVITLYGERVGVPWIHSIAPHMTRKLSPGLEIILFIFYYVVGVHVWNVKEIRNYASETSFIFCVLKSPKEFRPFKLICGFYLILSAYFTKQNALARVIFWLEIFFLRIFILYQ